MKFHRDGNSNDMCKCDEYSVNSCLWEFRVKRRYDNTSTERETEKKTTT